MTATTIGEGERIVRLTTITEGESDCAVPAESAEDLAAAIAADAPADPDIQRVEIIEPDGSVLVRYPVDPAPAEGVTLAGFAEALSGCPDCFSDGRCFWYCPSRYEPVDEG